MLTRKYNHPDLHHRYCLFASKTSAPVTPDITVTDTTTTAATPNFTNSTTAAATSPTTTPATPTAISFARHLPRRQSQVSIYSDTSTLVEADRVATMTETDNGQSTERRVSFGIGGAGNLRMSFPRYRPSVPLLAPMSSCCAISHPVHLMLLIIVLLSCALTVASPSFIVRALSSKIPRTISSRASTNILSFTKAGSQTAKKQPKNSKN